MKKVTVLLFAVMTMAITTAVSAFGQNGFAYQAVIRDANGGLVTNKQVEVKFTLKHDGTNFYSEKQNVKTNEYGNIQVVVGNGEKLDGDFANVPWNTFDIKMEVAVEIDGKYTTLGEVPVQGAPYAMHAQKAGGITSKNANTKDGDALFAVNDANGNPVFAVFADGIVVYVDDTETAKAKRSGFVVTGRSATKGESTTDYFSVTAEGTQIYVDDVADKAKRSGFVVTGRSATKDGDAADYLKVGGEGTTIFIDDDSSKAKRSGFVVTGRSATKDGDEPQYFTATAEGTTVYVDDTSADKAKRSGFVVTGRSATKGGEADDYMSIDGSGTQVYVDGLDSDKAKRSGFVVTGRSASKAEEDTLFAIKGGYTRVYINDEDEDKAKRSGFVVTGRTASKDTSATNIFNVSGDGNLDILTNDFTVNDTPEETEETDTAAVQPQPGDTTGTPAPAPVIPKPKSLFTISSGNVQVGTEMVMMGDVAKTIEADTISVDTVEAEFPQIAKIVDRADTISCAPYKPFIYGNDSDSEGYTLLGIYINGSLAKITATDSRKNKVILFDADGNVIKRQRNATVAVLMPEGDTQIYIRPLKATSQTISFGLMKKNASEPYQYVRVEAEIEASAGVPYKVTTSSNYGGQVVIDGTVAYGDTPSFEAVPQTGYKFVRWSDGSTRAKRTFTILDDFEISAEFERMSYVLTVKSDDEQFGTVSGSGTYLHGDTAFIEATPATGYYFNNWSGVELNDSLQHSPSLALEVTSKLKMIAHFGVMQYTITFDTDGGSEVAAITQDYNTKITAPADPQKEGFRFRGWSDTVPALMPAENLTLKAIWGINKYFITFNTDGGTPVDTLMYDFDEQVTAPEKNPTKEGFTFVGWDAEFPSTMPAKDLEFKAIWKVNRYALTWDANGGLLGNGLETDTDSLNFGDSIIAPVMARKGFWFYGWNDSVPATMPAKHLTYTALWDTMSYTIIYKNVDDDYSGKKTYDVTDTFDIKMPEKQGYEFVGWTGTNLKDTTKEITIKNDTGDIELTAIWASATMFYTVEHLQADMSGVHSMQAAIDTLTGKTDSLTEAVAKEFKGFEAQEFDQETIEPEDYATVVVIFYNRKSYELTWDANGGTIDGKSDSIQNRLFGDQIIGLDPVRPGYIFKGWNGMEDGYMDMPADNLTLVAKWESANVQYKVKHLREDLEGKFTIAEYDTLTGKTDSLTAAQAKQYEGFAAPDSVKQTTIAADGSTVVEIRYSRLSFVLTWDANGGKMGNGAATMIDTIAYGDSVWMPAMAREGYTFSGWSDTLVTMPAKDTTIKAQWKINQYTVVFEYGKDSVYQTITQDFGTELELPEEPTKPHYTFIGWSDTLATIPAEDTTIIDAVWAINQHTVTFGTDSTGTITAVNAKNEIVASGSKVDYGTVITLTPEPANGYFFIRWSDGDTSSLRTITADTTINAIFKNEFIAGGLKYKLTSASTVAVGKIDDDHKPIGELTIPATMIDSTDGGLFSVTAVDSNAFRGCTDLTTVIVSAGITNIAYSAFRECSNLASVSLPNGLRDIECAAFLDCGNLETINLPEGLTTIGLQAFFNCWKLTSVTFPTTFTTLGLEALSQTGLTSVNITSGITKIDRSPFVDCYNMTEITVDAENKNYVAENGVLYNKDKTILIQYPCGKTGSQFVVPDGVTHIERYAIAYSSNLKNVALPNSVTKIDFAAFFDDNNLETLTLPSSCTTILDEDAFARCPKLTIYCQAAEAPANTSAAKKVLTNCKAIKIQSADESLGTVSIATPGGYGADGSLWFPKDSTINLVASPATGYKLDKWTVADTTITSPYTISDTATITATWKPASYSITTISKEDGFGSVEITDGTMVDGGYEYGSEIELTATPWNYCHFVKWADDNSTDNPRYVTVSGETSYEAVFAPDTFTVTYNPNFNGATGSMAAQQTTYYDPFKLTPNAFAAGDYTFAGWATSANGDRVYTDSAVASFSANTTLYAIWVKAVIACDQQTFWNDSTLCVSALFARSNNAEFTPGDEPIKWQLKLTNFAGDTVLATSDSSKLTIPDTTELVEGKQYLLNARMVYDGKLNLNADLVVTATDSAQQTTEPTTFFFIDEKKGSYSNDGLIASSPFDNIDSALMRMNNASANYTICINGTLTGAQALDTWLNGKAKSITLCGLNGSDTLYGGFSADHRGTVLSIATSVPVTVKNLTITGGYAVENGGGIYVDAEANLTIASGTSIVNDTAFYSGGGIYTKGNCTMTGGRICNNVITFNGATFGGGVSADWDGKFTLQNGEISYNEGAYYGGGVVTLNGGTFEMTGGEISYNEGAYYGGGVATYDGGTFEMTGGEIVYNSADFGGGVYNGSSFTLSGGTISGNSSSTGSGLYIPSGSVSTLKDNAAVNKDNVVYLATEGSQITIAGELSADTVAIIKPYSYKSRKVLTRADGTAEDLIATQNDRFVVEMDGNGNLWSINDEGYLMQVADVDAIVNQIENLTESGRVTVNGYLTNEGVESIANAIKTINKDGVTIALDMSGVTGLTELERNAFYNCFRLSEIILPEGITSIGEGAFMYDSELRKIHIPSSVTEIDNWAFSTYDAIDDVTLGSSSTTFKMGSDDALYSIDGKKLVLYCKQSSTGSFTVPAEVEEIGSAAFDGTKLTAIYFEEGSNLEKIWDNAFIYSRDLASITLPKTLTSIGSYAFCGCGSLTEITIPGGTVMANSCFWDCSGITKVTIEDGVTELSTGNFKGCRKLATIDLPASLQTINSNAFNECYALDTVNYHGTPADSANMDIYDEKITSANVVWNFDYALYVSPKGSNSNSGTSAEAALQSLDSAFAKIVRNTATNYNYIINIDGTLRGPQAMGDSLNARAASITLIGANGLKDGIPQDSLAMSDGENARVLTIGTSTPIIIRNLAITGGRTVEEEDNGGGIYVLENANASLTIADGALIADNRTNESGGGIYVCSGNRALTMTGGSITGNEAYSFGGGVYVSDCQFTMTGGSISHNNAESGGGAYLFTQESTIGGKALISYNRAMNGGGLFICSGISDRATVRLTDFAKITNDTAYTSGGGVCVGYGIALAMNGFAEISGNIAGTEGGERGAGGGVYLDYDEFLSTFNMTGGTITGNKVLGSYTEGAGVYVNVRNFGESCQFGMGGNAVIAADNDVYLPVFENDDEYYNAPIIIMGDLTGEAPVATITPGEYIDSLQVLAAPSTIIKENYLKFAISNDDYTLGFNGELRPATYVDDKKYAVYQIEIGSQLNELIDTLNASLINCTEGIYISIANDLTLENHLPYDGDKDDNFRAFKGVFDGNGHTLTVKSFSPDIIAMGLVCVNNSGIIQNIKYEFANDSTIEINEVYGTAKGIYGGFCFYNYEDGIIRNCWNAASVHVKLLGRTGGICGGNSGLIENCLNTARLSAQWNKTSWNGRYGCIGGICGQNCGPGIVRNCVNYGEVYMPTYYFSSENDSGSINGMPGAICGTNEGVESIVENCYFRDSCLYCNRYSNEAVLPTNNMIYPAKSVRKGIVSGCGYFVIDSVNTTAALFAGNYDNCSSNQTLADYAEGDLLKALNGYVNAQSNPSLKSWKKENGKHAAVLNFGE